MLIIYSEKYSDFSSMMARYEEEMRRAYASAPHLEGTGVPAAAQEDNALEEKLARQDAAVQQAAELVLESLPTKENTTPDTKRKFTHRRIMPMRWTACRA